MQEPRVEKFIAEVCKKIKYKKVRYQISEELKNHIYDHAEALMDSGIEEEEAFKQSVEAMGDPVEIGKKLNKLHRPFLGWFINLTNVAIVFLVVLMLLIIVPSFFDLFESFGYPESGDIKYSINLKEKGKIDDRTIVVKKISMDKKNNIYIRFDEYVNPFGEGWSMMDFKVYDDLGNDYGHGSGGESKGNLFVTRHMLEVDKINIKANKIILDYNYYNRRLKIEIPLKKGDKI